jgi:hypothetical protein
MNKKSNLGLLVLAGLVLVVLLSAVFKNSGQNMSRPNTPINSNVSTAAAKPLELVTPSAQPTLAALPTPTDHPLSDSEVSIVLTTTAENPAVGEVFTITVAISNVGKLELRTASFGLDIYMEDGARQYQSSLDPMTEPLYAGKPYFTTFLPPGKSYVFEFPFRALRSGRAVLKGTISGRAMLRPPNSEVIRGWESILVLDIDPSPNTGK